METSSWHVLSGEAICVYRNKAGQDYDVFNPDSKAYDASKVTRAGIGLDPSSSDEEFMLQIEKLDKFYDTKFGYGMKNDQIDGTSTPRF